MSLTSLSRPPVPRLKTSLPFAIRARVDPDTRPASSRAPELVTSAAVETPSTAWSRGTVCAAVDRVTRSSAASNKLWVPDSESVIINVSEDSFKDLIQEISLV